MNKRFRKLLEVELARHDRLGAIKDQLLQSSFPAQAAFIVDPSKRKAAICTRRAGKTYGSAIMLIQTGLAIPGTTSVFLSYTRQTAKKQIEAPIRDLLFKYGVGYEFNRSNLEFTLENNSVIALIGADTHGTNDKLRGDKYALGVVDECGHGAYATGKEHGKDRLEYLVDDVFAPAIAQYGGTIALIGTAGNYTETYFHKVTTDQVPGWSVHRWSWEENISIDHGRRVCDAVREELQDQLALDPARATTDGYRREWKGEWAISQDDLVYRFTDKNLIPNLPENTYRYILGVDLGFKDATAFVVVGFGANDPTTYIVHSESFVQKDYFDVADRIRALKKQYGTYREVCDAGGGGLQGFETIRRRWEIPSLEATPKSPNYKYSAIQLMNGDFGSNHIRVLSHGNEALIDEYKKLTWSPKNVMQEDPAKQNHVADAALYAYRRARAYRNKPLPPQETNPNEPPQRYFPILEGPDDSNVFDFLDLELK